MRIRWDPVQVVDTADELDAQVVKIVKPLQRARALAEAARNQPRLPDYIKQRLSAFMFDVERVIGGERTSYHWNHEQHCSEEYKYTSTGSLAGSIESLRKTVPDDALKEAKASRPLFKAM